MEEYKKEQNRTKKERKEDGARTKRNAFVCAAAMMFIAAALMTAFTFAAPSSEDAGDDQTIGSNGDTFDYTSAPNLKLTYMVTSEDPNTAQVYGYISGITHEMRIPSTVTNNGKEYIVTSIGDGVFNAKENEEIKKKLNKVVLPDSVTVIGKEAFVHCANLEGINLDKITSVGMLAFIHCTSLTSVELPMAEIIEAGAFTNCNNMTYAFVGGSLTHLGEFAFYSDRLGALAIPYGTILGEQPVDHSVTVLVHYEGAPAVSAVRDGNEVKLTIHAEIPASELTVGTAHGGNGVTVTGEDHEWSFVKQFIKNEYYAKFVQAVSFTVSGKVTDGVNGIAGAAIAYTVTGTPGIQVIETANNGTYAIEAPWGSEVSIISVVRSGYVSAQSMPLYFSGKATQNFVMNGGHGTTYTVTGSVKHGTHALNGVNISYIIYGGGAGNVKTDANGKYVISGIPSGAVVHINDAQKDGFTNTTHLPAELYVDGNKTADIAMSPVPGHHLTISGKAELNGAGLENVTISYTADGINQPSALTDKFGNYKITVPAGSVVIITAAKDTYVVKTSYAELYMSENRTGVDFAFDYDRDHWAIVIFDPENGEPPAQVWHEIGTKLTKPDDPVKSTYKFAGWSFAGALWNFGSDIVGGDMTLTAEYDHDETYWATVIFDPDNSTGTTEIWHSKGTVLADPIIPVKGSLKFIGWFLSDAEWNFNDIVTKDITLKAKYENDPEYHYKVTFNADNGLPPQEVWTLKGDTVAEPAVPVKGSLTFIGWFLGDKEWDFNDAITLDITLKAKYENDPEYYFKVIFDADNGTGPEEAWVLKGTVVDEPNVPTKGSLTFVGWFLGDTEWNFSDAVTSDITLKAKYENDPEYHYKVTFDADNGSSTEAWVLKGEIVAEPGTPAKGSLTFIGWFLGDAKWDFADAIISDITLKAKYENDPEYYFKVIFDDDNGSSTEAWVLKGDTVAEPAVPVKGSLTFTGWFLNGTIWDFGDPVTEDMTLTAVYENDPEYYYEVTFDDDNSNAVIVWVLKGDIVAEPAVPVKGSLTFTGWFLNGTIWDFVDPVNEDMTLTAVYENDPEYYFKVIFDDDNGSSTEAWVLKGDTVAELAVPAKGSLTFVGWFLGDTEWNFSDAVTTDITLKAKYENDPEYHYKVTFNADNGLSPQEAWTLKGDIVAEPAVPVKGSLTFIGWFLGDAKWDFADAIISDITLKAKYENDPEYYFKVIFDDDNGSSTEAWVLKGETVSEPSVPTKGSLTFIGWFINGFVWDFGDPVNEDMTLTAVYENDPEYHYEVTFDDDNGNAVIVWILKGEIVGEPSVPTKGSLTFVGWFLGDTEWNFSDAVTTDITLKAKYENDPEYYYKVTFDADNGLPQQEEWVLKGDTVAEPTVPSKGSLTFIGWFVNGTIWDFAGPVNEDMTLTAVYENDPEYYFKVIFDDDNGNAVIVWVLKGDIVAEPAVPAKGSLTFTGWFLNDAEWDFADAVISDITLKAKYENDPEYYFKVIFDADNGTASEEAWALKGEIVAEPTVPTKGSLTFIGWYDGDTEWEFSDAVTTDITLKAKYENDPEYYFEVTFDDDNGNTVIVWVLKGDTVAEPAIPSKGSLSFIGWFVNGTIWDFVDPVNEDMTLTAVYENDPEYYYKVIFDGDNGSLSESWVLKGEIVAEPAVPVKGSLTFIGWFLGGTEWDFSDAVTTDITLKAKYGNDPDYYFKVVFDDDSGNAVIEWVLKDTQANEPSVPSKGSLTFIGWFIGGTEWDFGDAVTADMTLTAVYENDPEYYFKVMFDDDNGSSSEVWVLKGDTVAEPATPAKGSLTFIGWFVNGTIWDFGDSVISDITLTAVYENDPEYYHKVIFDGDNGSSSEVWVLKGDTVAEPAVPVNGSLTFTGWFIGDAEWEFGTAVNGDMTLVAKYAHDPITFTVTVSVTSADGGSFEYRIDNASVYEALTGPITVVCGSYIEIRAAVNDGYSFVWDDGRASENVIAFTVTCDEDLAGTFSLLTESDSTVIWSLLILAIFALLLIFTFFAGRGEEEE